MTWTLVTGGAKRLGADICLTLAKKGFPIVVHYNKSADEAFAVVNQCQQLGVRAECIQGDFSTMESTQDFIIRYLKQYSNTTNLINNVGNYLVKPPLNIESYEWISLFQTNLHAPCALINALVPSIKKQKGNIVNLGVTGLQNTRAATRALAYFSSKQALWLVTRTLALELAPSLVRVNMVSPGFLDISVDKPDKADQLPMHRLGTCQEVSRVIAFLLEPESAYITGQNIEVGGGINLG